MAPQENKATEWKTHLVGEMYVLFLRVVHGDERLDCRRWDVFINNSVSLTIC